MKRRKKNKKKKLTSSEPDFNYDDFRRSMIESINFRWVYHAFNNLVDSSEISRWEDSKKKMDLKTLLKWTKGLPLNLYHPLKVFIGYTPMPTLKRIYRTHISKQNITRGNIEWVLLHKFYGKDSPTEHRELERKNINSIDMKSDEFRFVDMCDFTLSVDIIYIIFSYIPVNFDMIVRIGGVCKFFYINFLITFPHVTIRKHTIRKTTLLVLQNVTELRFEYFSGVPREDYQYILESIDRNKIRKIVITSGISVIFNFFSSLDQYRRRMNKKNRSSSPLFPNLERIHISVKPLPTSHNKFSSSKYPITMKEIFPSLQQLSGLLGKFGLPLLLTTNFTKLRRLELEDIHRISNITSTFQKMTESDTFDKIINLTLSGFHNMNAIREIVPFFENLQEMTLIFKHNPDEIIDEETVYYANERFDFNDLNSSSSSSSSCKFSKLRKLVIKEKKVTYMYSPGYTIVSHESMCVDVNYNSLGITNLPNLEELEIDCLPSCSPRYEVVNGYNFNFFSLFESRFLSSSITNNVTIFRGRLPFFGHQRLVMDDKKIRTIKGDHYKYVMQNREKLVRCIDEFVNSFLKERMCHKFKIFDLYLKSRDFFFNPQKETLRIRYDRLYKRLRIRYFSKKASKPLNEELFRRPKSCFYSSNDNSENNMITKNEDSSLDITKLVKNIRMEKKSRRVCGLMLHLIIHHNIIGVLAREELLDFFECKIAKARMSRNLWKKILQRMKNDDVVLREKFEIVNGFSIVRKV